MTTPHDFRYVDGKVQRRVKGGNWQRLTIVAPQREPVESTRGTRPHQPATEWIWTDV